MPRFLRLWVVGMAGLVGWGLAVSDVAAAKLARSPEGRWIAYVPAKPYCSSSRLTLDVRGGRIVGNVINSEGVYAVAGGIDVGGSGVIRVGGVAGVIRFGAHRFVADYPNLRCGRRHAVGFKVG